LSTAACVEAANRPASTRQSLYFFALRFAGFEVLRALVEADFAFVALLFFAPLRALDFVALLRAVFAALLRALFLADFFAPDFLALFLAPLAADFFAPPLLDFFDEVALLLALAFGAEVMGSLMALPAASFILVIAD
jgi:hypothetical protein